ncbi:ABC-type uncharacterized transport system, substrate-binding protein [Rhizobiales bacterium GAS191]|jgi:ABC-type uncharacterized transport system substrate-binding protein|nr:ABC-type uncharacterized transport system, substrate-binding protein [Rhizobiales bacterium GAS113]SEC32107.1 ABC-type uncharacterized transport system, substrate-binding protein [Rhizobiales bacterium GAS191]SEC93130.1 ABC-type uncharacterized transport system, substrate-binding protein [Rhizobiales bacterium GAS188]
MNAFAACDPSPNPDRSRLRSLHRIVLFLAGAAVLLASRPAGAHPHVFVTTSETVLFDADGRVTAIKNAWTFDEYYTAFLEQGLDKGPDGRYSRETLADLAKTNTEGLADADYFTFIKANGRNVKFTAPKEYWLEDKGKVLVLHFTLPLAEPVKPSKAFVMRVYDPTYFVAFDPDPATDAVKLEGQKPGCSLLVRKPAQNDQLKQTLAAIPIGEQPTLEDAGAAFADSILVACP